MLLIFGVTGTWSKWVLLTAMIVRKCGAILLPDDCTGSAGVIYIDIWMHFVEQQSILPWFTTGKCFCQFWHKVCYCAFLHPHPCLNESKFSDSEGFLILFLIPEWAMKIGSHFDSEQQDFMFFKSDSQFRKRKLYKDSCPSFLWAFKKDQVNKRRSHSPVIVYCG